MILEEHREQLIAIAEALIEYETLTAEEIQKIVNGESIEEEHAKAEQPVSEPAAAETETPAENADEEESDW